jgi:hypothetical protein
METICYKNHEALKQAFCRDCESLRTQGCRETDPMDCDVALDAIAKKLDDGYKIVVGRMTIEPVSYQKPKES